MAFNDLIRLGASAASGYEIEKSLRFEPNDSTKLERIPSSTGNQKVWTWSGWVKRTKLGKTDHIFGCDNDADGNNNGIAGLYFNSSDDKLHTYFDTSGTAPYGAINDRVYRDTSSWYHIVWKVDAVNTETKIWVNGVEETVASGNMPPNYAYHMNESGFRMNMGVDGWDNGTYCNLYFAEVHYCDGQEYQASDFGETDEDTGEWIPKEVTGLTYGTNGFYLNFSDNSNTTAATLGKDSSGNGNNWTPTNFSVSGAATDSFEDTPTNNFPILNWNQTRSVTDDRIHSGGLAIDWQNAHDNASTVATFGMPSGKWYCEVTIRTDTAGLGSTMIGVFPDDYANAKRCQNTNAWPGLESGSGVGFSGTDQWYLNGSNQGTYGGSWATNDIIGVAIDVDTGKIALSKNGQWSDGSGNYDEANIDSQKDLQGVAPYYVALSDTSASHDPKFTINFGQRAFSHTIPTGYKKLCAKNLAIPTIKLADEYFTPVLYTGNGGAQSITSLNFQPNLVWNKNRGSATNHNLTDSVRGAFKKLMSNNTEGQADQTSDDKGTTAFLSNGFTVKDDASGNYQQNGPSGANFVAWCWKESASAGFDILSWTGNATNRTISHSLGVVPELMIVKLSGAADVWKVYHKDLGNTKFLMLNTTDGAQTESGNWNDTTPTSSVISIGTDNAVNKNSTSVIAYLFASIEGYSKVGSYTGNGQSDGSFIYTGFRPVYVLIKESSSSGENWRVFDSKRSPVNQVNKHLMPSGNFAESSETGCDFLSNGFKWRDGDGHQNGSGETYIYLAFAVRPFKYSNAH